jgi:hypothetical protein
VSHYRTQYEIVARNADGVRSFRVGFSRIKSRSGLLRAIRRRPEWFVQQTGIAPGTLYYKIDDKPGAWAIHAADWRVEFTGRTLRDVEQSEPAV